MVDGSPEPDTIVGFEWPHQPDGKESTLKVLVITSFPAFYNSCLCRHMLYQAFSGGMSLIEHTSSHRKDYLGAVKIDLHRGELSDMYPVMMATIIRQETGSFLGPTHIDGMIYAYTAVRWPLDGRFAQGRLASVTPCMLFSVCVLIAVTIKLLCSF